MWLFSLIWSIFLFLGSFCYWFLHWFYWLQLMVLIDLFLLTNQKMTFFFFFLYFQFRIPKWGALYLKEVGALIINIFPQLCGLDNHFKGIRWTESICLEVIFQKQILNFIEFRIIINKIKRCIRVKLVFLKPNFLRTKILGNVFITFHFFYF